MLTFQTNQYRHEVSMNGRHRIVSSFSTGDWFSIRQPATMRDENGTHIAFSYEGLPPPRSSCWLKGSNPADGERVYRLIPEDRLLDE